jgi:hypothetical protein
MDAMDNRSLSYVVGEAAKVAQQINASVFVMPDDKNYFRIKVKARGDHFIEVKPDGSCEAHGMMVVAVGELEARQ